MQHDRPTPELAFATSFPKHWKPGIGVMPCERVQRSVPSSGRNLPVDCKTGWYRAKRRFPPLKIIHTQRSLFFSHVHTRFVLCLRKGIYLWKRAISKTLRSAEWLKGAAWYKQKNLKKMLGFSERVEQRIKKITRNCCMFDRI